MPAPDRGRNPGRLFPLFLALAGSACTTLRVPATRPAFAPAELRQIINKGIEVRAKAIEERQQYVDLFNNDLPEIGIVAIWASVANCRDEALDLRRSPWGLRIGGRVLPALSNDKLFDLFYRRRGIRMYSLHTDEVAKRVMAGLLFHEGILPNSEFREGFVFFRMDSGRTHLQVKDATLLLRVRLPGQKRKQAIELQLSYANP